MHWFDSNNGIVLVKRSPLLRQQVGVDRSEEHGISVDGEHLVAGALATDAGDRSRANTEGIGDDPFDVFRRRPLNRPSPDRHLEHAVGGATHPGHLRPGLDVDGDFEHLRILLHGASADCCSLHAPPQPQHAPTRLEPFAGTPARRNHMAVYTLPDLPYDPAALEPHYSGQIVELHHGKHHAAYVAGANTTLEKLEEARAKGDYAAIVGLEKTLAFNISGHVLHSIFWTNLSPEGGDRPTGDLAAKIDVDFGSFDAFQAHMTQASTTVQGSGWGALAYEPLGDRLVVTQVYDHQSNLTNGSVPIFVIDAWEHAWYLQYKNVKADYVTALWNIINWDDVARRFAAAKATSLA